MRQYLRPDTTDGILAVPLKGYGHSCVSGVVLWTVTTVHQTRNIYIHNSGVPYPRFIPQFHPAHAGKTEISDIEVTPALAGAGLQSFRSPAIWEVSWFPSETAVVLRFQTCGLETISTTRSNGRSPDSFLERVWIRVYER